MSPRFLFPAVLLAALVTAPVLSQDLLALTSANQLVPLRAGSSVLVGQPVPITGLQAGESILGIDVRPATGQLYGLGSSSRLYRIDPGTGAAVQVGPVFATALQGLEFGFDFNPTVDRIRVVSDAGQNLRLHPDTGAVAFVDGSLAYAATDPNVGRNPAVAASGYTNSVAGALSTTLYGIDTTQDVLVTQNPPNSGTLNTVGPLGRDVTAVAGFDIVAGGPAYAALNSTQAGAQGTQLYTIDLATGTPVWIGNIGLFGGPSTRIRGLCALPPAAPTEIVALTADNRLIAFEPAAPWLTSAPVAVTGLQAGETLLAIDFRPATGQLYGLGSQSRLYAIDTGTATATQIGPVLTTLLQGTEFGFDFNPTVDRIRVVSSADQNLRLHPDTGAVAFVDSALAFAATDPNAAQNPNIVGSAYTNNLPGATSTLLYGIDSNLDVLVTQNPPNSGTLNTVGSLGLDVSATAGFDITPGTNIAYAAFATGGQVVLCSIDLATGAATVRGTLAQGLSIRGLAARPVAGLRLFGTATPGCSGAPLIGAAGSPFAGNRAFAVLASNAAPGNMGFFAIAFGPPISPVSFNGLAIWVDPMSVALISGQVVTPTGTARAGIALPANLFGTGWAFQFIDSDPCGAMGLAGTSGLHVTLQ